MFDKLLSPASREWDMIHLALLAGLPTLFALVVAALPRRRHELLRWVALTGTAATLAFALCRLVDYYAILDSYSDRSTATLYHPAATLEARSDQQMADAAQPVPRPYRSDDLLTRRPWVARLDLDFALGLDGFNLAAILAVCVVALTAVIATWWQADGVQSTLAALLAAQSALIGALLSLDLLLMLCFAELLAVPVALLLGKHARRFLIAWLAGGGCLLGAILMLHAVDARDFVDQGVVTARALDLRQLDPTLSREAATERAAVHTFDFVTLGKVGRAVALVLSGQEQRLTVQPRPAFVPLPGDDPHAVPLFAAGVDRDAALTRLKDQPAATPRFQAALFALLALGFALKLGVWPASRWLTDPARRLPTAAMMTLATVPLFGAYGFVRLLYALAPWGASQATGEVAALALLQFAYMTWKAFRATDLSEIAAATLLGQLALAVVGAAAWSPAAREFEWGVAGGAFQLLTQPLAAAGTLFAAGCLARRYGHADADLLGGVRPELPRLTALALPTLLGATLLPGLGGFVGQFAILNATANYCLWLGVPAVILALLATAARLRLWAQVFLGEPRGKAEPAADLDAGESVTLALFAALLVVLGVLPSLAWVWLDPAVQGAVAPLARLR